MVLMGDKTTKTVKVPESKAEEWEAYVEDNAEVDSISHLIRLSVQKEISGAYDVDTRRSDGDSTGANGEILTHLRKIETAIDDVETRVAAVEGVKSAEANYDIQKATFNTLPEPPDSEVFEVPESGASKDSSEQHTAQKHPSDFAVTSDEIARQLGAETEDVEEALTHLRETTGQVRRVSGGPENRTYYWRKGR